MFNVLFGFYFFFSSIRAILHLIYNLRKTLNFVVYFFLQEESIDIVVGSSNQTLNIVLGRLLSFLLSQIFGCLLKKTKKRKEYDQIKVFQYVWSAQLPWAKSMVNVNGKMHQVRCKASVKLKGKKKY
jgi:hypothetical protein